MEIFHPIWSVVCGLGTNPTRGHPVNHRLHYYHLDWGREGSRVDQSRISLKSAYFQSNWILSSLLSSLETVQPNGQTDQPAQTDWSDPVLWRSAAGLDFINRFQRVVALKSDSNRPDRSPPTKSLRSPPYGALFGQIRLDLFRSRRFRLDLLNKDHIRSKFLLPDSDRHRHETEQPDPSLSPAGGGSGNFTPEASEQQ